MATNILPTNYPNIYYESINRWVDSNFYIIFDDKAELNEVKHDEHKSRKYSDEYLLIVLADNLSKDIDMAILAIEFGVVKKDVFIYNIEIIGYTTSEPDFDKMNKLAKEISFHKLASPYQEYERFYGGYVNEMTVIKDMVMDIVDYAWYNDPDLEWF